MRRKHFSFFLFLYSFKTARFQEIKATIAMEILKVNKLTKKLTLVYL